MAISPGGRPADASPLGKKKGGPRRLTDYTREIAHALMRRGVPEGHAIAIARSQQAKWRVTSKNPAIRAAAAASTAAGHVLDHNKRGRQHDMTALTVPSIEQLRVAFRSPSGQIITGPYDEHVIGVIDLDWSEWNAQHQGAGTVSTEPDMLSADTHQKLMALQRAHGLPVTGTLDSQTVAWLNNPANAQAALDAKNAAAATKAAAPAVKAKKTADAAAKKTAAATTKAAKAKMAATAKTAADAAKAQRTQAAQQLAAQRQATANGQKAVAAGKPLSFSVPIVASDDGPRMTNQAMLVKAARKELKRRRKARR